MMKGEDVPDCGTNSVGNLTTVKKSDIGAYSIPELADLLRMYDDCTELDDRHAEGFLDWVRTGEPWDDE